MIADLFDCRLSAAFVDYDCFDDNNTVYQMVSCEVFIY